MYLLVVTAAEYVHAVLDDVARVALSRLRAMLKRQQGADECLAVEGVGPVSASVRSNTTIDDHRSVVNHCRVAPSLRWVVSCPSSQLPL